MQYLSVYAHSIEEVVSTSYDMVNRKLFSVPKLLLLPQVIVKEPMLLVKIFPLILSADFLKGRFVAYLSNEVERLKKEEKDVSFFNFLYSKIIFTVNSNELTFHTNLCNFHNCLLTLIVECNSH